MTTEFFESYSKRLAYQVKDLEACEHERIHRIGAIQDFGYFLACDADLRIIALSENFSRLFDKAPEALIGSPLNDILAFQNDRPMTLAAIEESYRNMPPAVWLRTPQEQLAASVSFHRGDNGISIDLECDLPSRTYQSSPHLHHLMTSLETSSELDEDCRLAVTKIREITQFDRVMIYKFHANWDGEVIAEDAAPGLESFLHLRYPASDIPAQARQLYLQQNYRLIADSHELPVAVICRSDIHPGDIDLSQSNLRASSPIHVQYLQNMGVRASFSVPLKVQNRLWGLVSCHNYERTAPLSLAVRSACELAARILSGRIAHHVERRRLIAKRDTLEFTQSLFRYLTEGRSPLDAFREVKDGLMALTESNGAVIRIQGEQLTLGQCPPPAVIEAIFEKAKSVEGMAIWKSDSLARDLNRLDLSGVAGALASPLSFGFEEGLVWFRPEQIQEVHWGGKPDATKKRSAQGTLEPRASFAAWTAKVEKHCRPWVEQNEESAQYLLFNFMKGIFAKASALASANRELERMARAKDEFIGLVSHELRTPLSAIIGWVDILKDLIPPQSQDVTEAVEIIDRNARLQVNLINDLLDISRIISGKLRLSMHSGVQLGTLIGDVIDSLRPTAEARSIRIDWDRSFNPVFTADPNRLRQVVWNLLSNAIKFTPKEGRVRVELSNEGSSYSIRVIDNGAGLERDDLRRIFDRFTQVGPDSQAKGGLGLGLSIVKALVELHGGTIRAESAGLGSGSTFIVNLPIFVLKQDQENATWPGPEAPNRMPFRPALQGLRILVAEDQKDSGTAIKFLVERMQGHCVLVTDGRQALEAMESQDFDLIISDIGMPGMDGYSFIERLRSLERAQGLAPISAIALTAYASSKDRTKALESGFQSHIPKPVDRNELVAVIESLKLEKRRP